MRDFRRLIDDARGRLSSTPKLERDTVVQDVFDRTIFSSCLSEATALQEIIARTNKEYDYTEELFRDVFTLFHQGYPEMRGSSEIEPSRLINHAVVTDVALAPDTEPLRAMTNNDRYSAAMATIGVAEKVQDGLKRHAEEQQKAEQEVQEARERVSELENNLEDVTDGAENLLDDIGPNGEGPVTEDQSKAVADLQDAIDALDAAVGELGGATGVAQDLADGVGQQLRVGIRSGVAQVKEALAEQEYVMKAWGISPAQLQRMSFDERNILAKKLMTGNLSKFYKMMGRFKMQASADQARKVKYARDEVVGTRLSGDLQDVISSELVMSRHRALRLDFLQRFADGQILSKLYEGVERVGQGPIIVCVDSSGSMGGPRDVWAKSFALALVESAHSQRRDLIAMHFSYRPEDLRVYRFPKGERDINTMIDFVTVFLGGGTDFQHPIDKSISIMENELEKADLIFITDGECSVSTSWLENYHESKKRLGFRTYGLAVGSSRPGSTLQSFSDNVRGVTDFLSTDQCSDIFRNI